MAALEKRGWRLGLDRMTEFVRRAGLDSAVAGDRPRYIHIAGTNGKGSVTAYVQSILVEAGWRTGAFFSPFVYNIRERVQFGREQISETDFARLTERLLAIGDHLADTEYGGVTEFELKAALGFAYWHERECDWVSLEVGLGGRLDATNVVEPACSVIVSIGLDHMHILGNSIEEIAAEKAGIIKPGRPVVIGRLPEPARRVMHEIARDRGCDLYELGVDFESVNGLKLGLTGPIQHDNAAVASQAVRVAGAVTDESAIARGLALAYAPGRFERVGDFVLDGAHNVDAAVQLVRSLRSEFPEGTPITLISGMMSGHEPDEFYKTFEGLVQTVHLCPIAQPRSQDPNRLREAASRFFLQVLVHNSAEQAIEAARNDLPSGGVIVVTGSFYLVGEIGNILRASGLWPCKS